MNYVFMFVLFPQRLHFQHLSLTLVDLEMWYQTKIKKIKFELII